MVCVLFILMKILMWRNYQKFLYLITTPVGELCFSKFLLDENNVRNIVMCGLYQ